jgi:hypothetical protein
MTKNIIIAVLAVALLGLGYLLHLAAADQSFGATGQTHYQIESFLRGLTFGTTRQGTLASDGSLTVVGITNSSGTSIGSGTVIQKYKCATATWNPPSLGTSSVTLAATTTDILLTGAVAGDLCVGSLTTATTSLAGVSCVITASGTSTIRAVNYSAAALDLDSGTAKVCYIH